MIRCAIYIRVSTEEQAIHGLSLEAQKEELIEYAKKNNYEIVDIYADEGKTARKSLSKRLELKRLLDDVSDNKIDIIIFTKLDRWFRNVRDYHKVQEVLEAHKVDWKTIKENYDTSTANGRLHINIMLSVAQDEADRTSERIKAVFQNKLKNGEAISGSLPIGYKIENKKVVIDNDKINIAKDVFNFYKMYQSQTSVHRAIMEKYDISLCEKTIRRCLANEIYKGTYRGHDNLCEAILTEDEFMDIQRILTERNIKHRPATRPFIFTGILICAECDHKLTANLQRRHYGVKEYVLYKCSQHYTRKLCIHNKVMYETKLEEYLLQHLDTLLEKHILDCEKIQDATPAPQAKVNKSQVKKKLEKLKELYVNDLIDIDMYKSDYNKYNELLNYEPQVIKKRDLAALKSLLRSNYKEMYAQLSFENKRIFWRQIIKQIKIDAKNHVEVEFL